MLVHPLIETLLKAGIDVDIYWTSSDISMYNPDHLNTVGFVVSGFGKSGAAHIMPDPAAEHDVFRAHTRYGREDVIRSLDCLVQLHFSLDQLCGRLLVGPTSGLPGQMDHGKMLTKDQARVHGH